MNHLERAYTNMQLGYSQALMFANNKGNNKGLDDYIAFDVLLEEKVFPKMLQDGGRETERGVEYRGFEYRLLRDGKTTAGYIKNTINPKLKELGLLHSPEAEPESYKACFEAFEMYAESSYLASMASCQWAYQMLNEHAGELLKEYEQIDNDFCSLYFPASEMIDYIVDCCIGDDNIKDILDSEDVKTEDIYDSIDYSLSKTSIELLKKIGDMVQISIKDENGWAVSLPYVTDGENFYTYDEIEKKLNEKLTVVMEFDVITEYEPTVYGVYGHDGYIETKERHIPVSVSDYDFSLKEYLSDLDKDGNVRIDGLCIAPPEEDEYEK